MTQANIRTTWTHFRGLKRILVLAEFECKGEFTTFVRFFLWSPRLWSLSVAKIPKESVYLADYSALPNVHVLLYAIQIDFDVLFAGVPLE